jgi:uncharacterized repeat protein (TIGR03803 family)
MPPWAPYATHPTFLIRRLTHSALVLAVFVLVLPSADAAAAAREHVIYSFSLGYYNPLAPLIADKDGNLYATASNGGPNHAGCVFELSPKPDGSWREKTLHIFDVADGVQPQSALTFDKLGNLYGTAGGGGAYGAGVVFKLSPSPTGEWTETTLYNFGNGDGVTLGAELVFDKDGNLYGTTEFGGIGTGGIVYRLSPSPSVGPKPAFTVSPPISRIAVVLRTAVIPGAAQSSTPRAECTGPPKAGALTVGVQCTS